jgi:outer membrane protein TolC
MTWMEKRMEIVQEMRGALRDLVDAKAATEAAHEALVLAREQYQAELVRLENQHSTTFQVREMQRDMFQAEDVETAAITQYEVLRAGLEKARGDLAQSYGVDWKPEPRPKDAPKE